MKTILILLCLCASLIACDRQNPLNVADGNKQTGIVGGTEVKAGEMEARAVVMVINQRSGEICTGALIRENVVLTAAHCVIVRDSRTEIDVPVYVSPDDMKISFGLSPFTDESTEIRDVVSFASHEDYRLDRALDRRDLAVLRFDGGLPPGHEILELATGADLRAGDGLNFTAVGYGRTNGDLDRGGEEGVLRKTGLQGLFVDEARFVFQAEQAHGTGVCFGDSGGPALRMNANGRWAVFGVASGVFNPDGGDSCAGSSLYMNVAAFNAWIADAANGLNATESGPKGSPVN